MSEGRDTRLGLREVLTVFLWTQAGPWLVEGGAVARKFPSVTRWIATGAGPVPVSSQLAVAGRVAVALTVI